MRRPGTKHLLTMTHEVDILLHNETHWWKNYAVNSMLINSSLVGTTYMKALLLEVWFILRFGIAQCNTMAYNYRQWRSVTWKWAIICHNLVLYNRLELCFWQARFILRSDKLGAFAGASEQSQTVVLRFSKPSTALCLFDICMRGSFRSNEDSCGPPWTEFRSGLCWSHSS